MKRSIKGFEIDWGGPQKVFAKRLAAPKHGYNFKVSAGWHVSLCSRSPVDVADGDPDEDAMRFEKEAGKAVEEFLRKERGDT